MSMCATARVVRRRQARLWVTASDVEHLPAGLELLLLAEAGPGAVDRLCKEKASTVRVWNVEVHHDPLPGDMRATARIRGKIRSKEMLGCGGEGPTPPHPFRSDCDICEDGRASTTEPHTRIPHAEKPAAVCCIITDQQQKGVASMNMYSKLITGTSQELILGRSEIAYAQPASAQQPEALAVIEE
ncbi:cullulin 3 [Diaporthe eres]|nr:cullulin 3 [Diaporthe eres]